MVKLTIRKNITIGRIMTAIVSTVLILYIGGNILTHIANTMIGTCSGFYQGLSLFGWSVGDNVTAIASLVMQFVELKTY